MTQAWELRSLLMCVSWSIDRECPRREKDDCNRYGVADQERCHRLISIQPAGFDFARSSVSREVSRQ